MPINWYAELSTWKQARIGTLAAIAIDIEDLHQCIETILKTYPGEDCLRPFGSYLRDHIDLPVDVAKPLIIRDVAEAIARWEPRVELLKQDVVATIDGVFTLTILWKVKGYQVTNQSVLSIGVK